MKKKTIEIPLLPRAKWDLEICSGDDMDFEEADVMNEALYKQTKIFLQTYADHVTEGNPASALHQFIYFAMCVWNDDIKEVFVEAICEWGHGTHKDSGHSYSDLKNGSTKEAKEFKAEARKLINGEYETEFDQQKKTSKVTKLKFNTKRKDALYKN